jgi:hypothetical protein
LEPVFAYFDLSKARGLPPLLFIVFNPCLILLLLEGGMPVKFRMVLAVLFGAALLLCSGNYAQAQIPILITVDEDGNGTILSGGVIFPTRGVLMRDPGPGGLAAVLTYDLLGPPALVAGDVLLQDGVGGPFLDVVRFNPRGTGGNPNYPASLLFYSDNLDGFDNLGDTTGPPTQLYPNVRIIPEVGLEGNFDGAIYTPGPNDPGFVPGFQVTYVLISDTPEPASLTLFGIGAVTAAVVAWRRRRLLA